MFAWELGAGTGHVNRLLPLADGLSEAGHDPVLAMRDPPITRRILGARAYKLIQAPVPTHIPGVDRLPASWADLLLNSGYTSTDAMRFLLAGWLALFDREQPDLLITEFAPAAMLAARIAGLRVMSIGDGWTLPPRTTPLPSIQPWSDIPMNLLAAAESHALGVINATLVGFGRPPLVSLAALFDGTDEYLCCFPELDHYADRGEADCYGPIYQTELGMEPEWPAIPDPRVFAYLSGGEARSRMVIDALGMLGWPAVIYARDQDPDSIPPNVWIASGPLKLDTTLKARPMVICGGLNMTSAALVAGCPVLSIPDHQEQLMLAHRVARQQFGLIAPPNADAGMIASRLRDLHDHQGIAAHVGAFAGSYQGYRPAMAVRAIVDDMLTFLPTNG